MDKKKPNDKVHEVPLSYEDYASIDDGNRYELSGGVLDFLAGPTPSHQLICQEVQSLLKISCNEDFIFILAPIDVIFENDEVRQPDLVAIHRSRLSIISKRGIEGAPDLVVEVISPSSIKRDRGTKMEVYARYQVNEYWIVDPGLRVIEQYVLNGERYQLMEVFEEDMPVHSEKFPCASFSMNDLWSNIPDLPNA